MGKTKFHEKKYSRIRRQIIGLIARLWREKLTHAELLAERSKILASEEAKSLPSYVHLEMLGMLRGAEELLFLSQAIVWAHKIDGQFVDVNVLRQTRPDYIDHIEKDASRHVWAGTQKVFGIATANFLDKQSSDNAVRSE